MCVGPHEKTLELQLRQFISFLMYRNLNPRSLVQIVIQILSVDTTAINPVIIYMDVCLTKVDEYDTYDSIKCGDVSLDHMDH